MRRKTSRPQQWEDCRIGSSSHAIRQRGRENRAMAGADDHYRKDSNRFRAHFTRSFISTSAACRPNPRAPRPIPSNASPAFVGSKALPKRASKPNSRHVQEARRVRHGTAADADAIPAVLAEELSAARRHLQRVERGTPQTLRPVWNEGAMRRPGHRIFRNARARREESGDEIAAVAGRGGDDAEASSCSSAVMSGCRLWTASSVSKTAT